MTHAWANGFGVWHVRVSRAEADPRAAASAALREELEAREANLATEVWSDPQRVPDLDDEATIVYTEGTPP